MGEVGGIELIDVNMRVMWHKAMGMSEGRGQEGGEERPGPRKGILMALFITFEPEYIQ